MCTVCRRANSIATWRPHPPAAITIQTTKQPAGESRVNRRRLKPLSEEKVALVCLAFRPAVSPEAHFFSIVGTEFVAEKLSIRRTPGLQLPIHNRQSLSTESTAARGILFTEDFSHL
jgi:hypothetical protein